MAKTKKRKKQQKLGASQQMVHDRKGYFESGRARKLSLGTMYMAKVPDKQCDTLYMIVITRQHVNGNSAVASFFIGASEEFLNCGFYDYNLEPELLEKFVNDFNLKPFDNYASLHHTIYEVNRISRQKGFEAGADLEVALMILEEESAAVPKKRSLLKTWAAADGNNSKGSKRNKNQKFRDLPNAEKEELLAYKPNEVEGWTKKQWGQYLSLIKSKDLFDCLLIGVTPLFYVFEKCIFSLVDTQDQGLVDSIERLVRLPTRLTAEPLKKIGQYKISEEEMSFYRKYFKQISRQNPSSDYKGMIRELRAISSEYPENPQFYNLENACHQSLQDEVAIYESAKKTYTKFPEYLFAKINYIQALTNREEFDTVEMVLNGKYILEEMYPERNEFHYSEYKQYYLVLCEYLIESGQFSAGWLLYKAFVQSPNYEASDLDDIRLVFGTKIIKVANIAVNWLKLHNDNLKGKQLLYKDLGV